MKMMIKFSKPLKAGAEWLFAKEDKAINIVEAMKNVVQFDGIPMSPAIARRAMELLRDTPKTYCKYAECDYRPPIKRPRNGNSKRSGKRL